MGHHVADMAFKQDAEFEMLHRIRVLFTVSNDLSILGKATLNTKVKVSRMARSQN